ncbi:MAG: 50S ribosomal protein L3 [Candidatus Lambdaproteobacteria bacterium RIFOXYD2_FULL_50_16]|uniref:Large ribosomal subunit protein uL3 n=1 Tax=Candidatus Lambdaproteobacteria bacterium RIFOXYD2_FULL_50_16 TaxID=1817772 RepID=A0A1F6G5G8_9PROT|nr:MAG: 50S ribosomal protein L3 [Candidatus Lambdaproteobacteria bacterium RIFOXYD2_FULL_50_16]
MLNGLIGKKAGMSQVFSEDGTRIPVTVIELGPVTVTQIKTVKVDGYDAVQVGYDELSPAKAKNLSKAVLNHLGENKPVRHLMEFLAKGEVQVGQSFDVTLFEKGQKVDVTGTTKGKGFAGVIKRHGFGGGPGAHGHRFHRSTGSIGQSATPSRVWKNKRMPGHMGNEKMTVQNLEVVAVRPELNAILVKGAVPGPQGRLVEVRHAIKAPK